MNSRQYFAIFLAISVAIAPEADALLHPIKKAAAAAVSAAHWKAKLPFFKIKKALLLAPIKIPLAIGAKSAKIAAGTVAIAVPAGIGAAMGAPLGAIIGAKAGAIKGAAVGKALFTAKMIMAGNAAAAGLALASKPVVLAVGAKAKAAAAGVHFAGKGIGLAAKGASFAGAALASAGKKLSDASLQVKLAGAAVADQIKTSLTSLPQVAMPSFTESIGVPTIPLETLTLLSKGPKELESIVRVNHPLTGERYAKASFMAQRRKRQAPAQGRRQGAQQVNHLVNFVQSNQMQGCVARIICELSANPNLYGAEGIQFGRSLQSMSSVQHPATQQYRAASTVGTQIRNPQECAKRYTSCTIPSNDLIRIGNQMLRT
ncbi:hypothetical protein HDE_09998 [Halotydeus destructor]|nr:hypothetical protein HDE_09998 [Halotydeus destructor]